TYTAAVPLSELQAETSQGRRALARSSADVRRPQEEPGERSLPDRTGATPGRPAMPARLTEPAREATVAAPEGAGLAEAAAREVVAAGVAVARAEAGRKCLDAGIRLTPRDSFW